MKYGSLFTGIGGFDLGLDRAGMSGAWQVEIDPFCVLTLDGHWPGVPKHGDIREVDPDGLDRVDLVCGGSPCQDLSTAGKRAGLAGERSGLFHEFIRISDSLSPRWILFENVPGLLSSHQGRDFAIVLRELTGFWPQVPKDGWRNSGVCVGPKRGAAWRVLDAQYFGVAQRRRRVFIVCDSGDGSAALQVLLEPESGGGNTPPKREKGAVAPALSASGAGTGRTGNERTEAEMMVVSIDARNMTSNAEVTHTLSTGAGKQAVNHEVLIAQAFPDPAYAVAAGGGGSKFGSGRDGQDTYVVEPTTRWGDPGHVFIPEQTDEHDAVIFEARVARNGRGAPAGIAPPLKAQNGGTGKGDGAPLVAPTLRGFGHGWQGQHNDDMAKIGMVRRLTPVECERLMGFPDGWTDLGGGASDSPRYRALGNAVVVNVTEWIGRRIIAMVADDPNG